MTAIADNNLTRERNGGPTTSVDTLVLTYDRARDQLEIGGHCNSLDLMLDILARAQRVLEAKWRAQQVAAMLQERAEAERTAALLQSIRGGKG